MLHPEPKKYEYTPPPTRAPNANPGSTLPRVDAGTCVRLIEVPGCFRFKGVLEAGSDTVLARPSYGLYGVFGFRSSGV